MRQEASAFTTILALALLGCPSVWANTLHFARVHYDSESQTGIAVSSTQATPGTVAMALFDGSGAVVALREFPISGYGQIVGTVGDLLQAPEGFVGWLRVDSDADLHGMGILVDRRTGLISESPASRIPDRFQFMSHVAIGEGWKTEIAIANASGVPTTCRVLLYDRSGVLLGASELSLPAFGHRLLDVGSLFRVSSLLSGHVEVVGDHPLVAVETFRSEGKLASAVAHGNAQPGSDGQWSIVFPWVLTADENWTGFAYINQSGTSGVVEEELFDEHAMLIKRRQTLVHGKAQVLANVNDISDGWRGRGYLKITADVPLSGVQVTGFRRPKGVTFSAWSGVTEFGSELFVPHVAEVDDWTSSVSLINLASASVTVQIMAADSQGVAVAQTTITLAPGEQLLRSLRELLPVQGRSSGSLKFLSNLPLAGANIFGNSVGGASIPGAPAGDVELRSIPVVVSAAGTVTPDRGGTVTVPEDAFLGGMKLTVPAGAVEQSVEVQLLSALPSLPSSDANLNLVQYPIRLLPEGVRLQNPAVLRLPVARNILGDQAALLQFVTLAAYDSTIRRWVRVPITRIDREQFAVEAEITQLAVHKLDIPRVRLPLKSSDSLDLGSNGASEDRAFSILGGSPKQEGIVGAACAVWDNALLPKETVDLIQQGHLKASPEMIGLTDLATVACDLHEVNKVIQRGDSFEIAQKVLEVGSEYALKAACRLTAYRGGATNRMVALCDSLVDYTFAVSHAMAEHAGKRYADMRLDENAQRFNEQIIRYVLLRQKGNGRFDVPRCAGDWFQHPTIGCQPGFDDKCSILNRNVSHPCAILGVHVYTVEGAMVIGEAQYQHWLRQRDLRELQQLVGEAIASIAEEIKRESVPVPVIHAMPSDGGTAPIQITFDSSGSTSASQIVNRLWDFGDGQKAEGEVTVKHTYSTEGEFTVKLTIINGLGQANSTTLKLRINPSVAPPTTEASPRLRLDRSTLEVPSRVIVEGTSFRANTALRVYWQALSGASYSSDLLRASGSGTFTYELSFGGNSQTGEYRVFATEEGTGRSTPPVVLNVTNSQPRPVVDRIEPEVKTIPADRGPQEFTVAISGRNFVARTYVRVYYARDDNYAGEFHRAGELTGIVTADVIAGSAIALLVPLRVPVGEYDLVVFNPDGKGSDPKRLRVLPEGMTPESLRVNSINPPSPPASGKDEPVQVSGSHFQPGLAVDLFSGSGAKVGTLSGAGQIQNVTAASFTMLINLGTTAGSAGIEVVNPDGKRSARFTFTTR